MKNRSKFVGSIIVGSIIVGSIIVGSIVLLCASLAPFILQHNGPAVAAQQQLAFPEAEGYGKYATGGRGGGSV